MPLPGTIARPYDAWKLRSDRDAEPPEPEPFRMAGDPCAVVCGIDGCTRTVGQCREHCGREERCD